MKSREFIKRLKRNGVEIALNRGKGGHVWAIYQGKKTTIPVHGSTDFDPQFLKVLCKQLGIEPEKVL